MSDIPNDQQNPNTRPEPGLFTPDFSDPVTPPDIPEEPPSFVPEEIPLPDFDQEKMEDKTPETSAETAPTWPDLEDSLAVENAENVPRAEGEAPRRVYKISSAEPDWSDFTLPPLDDPRPEEETTSGWKTAWAIAREVGETIILTLIIFFLIQTVIRNFRVVGTSMVDNLHNGQYLIIDKLSYSKLMTEVFGIGGPKRGDVIVFEPPNRSGEDYVKRIIGLPGETVEITRGQVFINGQALDESFQPRSCSYSMPPQVVPENELFVLGDNRNNSNDSPFHHQYSCHGW